MKIFFEILIILFVLPFNGWKMLVHDAGERKQKYNKCTCKQYILNSYKSKRPILVIGVLNHTKIRPTEYAACLKRENRKFITFNFSYRIYPLIKFKYSDICSANMNNSAEAKKWPK